jgi:chromosome segregation protein
MMPYIKRIEVNGFKTFGRKTTLELDKGFTAITGPNGSGKTNIIDAVLFGLGELSARRLRATNFSSLIFHGNPSPDIKKRSKAKVIIQFDNSDGRLPTDTVTVTASREIDQNGQSVYRINGHRVSRSYAIEILSMAGISPYGHNVILQGALTRLAEISPSERRKIIEDMIGIAQYDSEKTEAEQKLTAANISIKTAMGQVGEVQQRIESLEKERNDLLRHNFIREEIKCFDAIKLSQEITDTQQKTDELSSQIEEVNAKIEKIRTQREALRSKRREIEAEWRGLGFEKVEENQARIFQIQIRIGEMRSKLAELSTKLSAGKASLDSLVKVKSNAFQQIEVIKRETEEAEERIKQLISEQDSLTKEAAAKQSAYDEVYDEAAKARENLEEKTHETRECEEQLEQLYQEAITLRSQQAEAESRISVHSERLRNLEAKRKDMESYLSRLEESLTELKSIQNERRERLTSLQDALQRRNNRKKLLETEIEEAGKIADIAREALVEFEARKELVDKVRTEEAALKHIEELGELDIIHGIHGRLKDLIKVQRGYERAVEAAATGWLNSIVVKDVETAFTCVETLRKLKLGRIKIVPLEGIFPANQLNVPELDGIQDKVSAFVSHDSKYKLAVSYVFGDTLLAANAKAALEASRVGLRSVTRRGDLYEAGGGVESGFYRAPLDFSSFVPSESALKTLDRAVTVLRDNLARRETDIGELEEEMTETQEEITGLAETLGKLEVEIEKTRKSIQDTKLNASRAEKNLVNLQSSLDEETTQIKTYVTAQEELSQKVVQLREQLESLRKTVDLSEAQDREQRREVLGSEVITLRQKLGGIEAELSTLQSKVETVLKAGLENARVQQERVSNQISTIEREIEEAGKEKEQIQTKVGELEKTKEELSSSFLNARGEASRFTSQIDGIDGELKVLESEYEQTDALLDELRLNLQTLQLRLGRQVEELKGLGYKEPIEAASEQLENVEVSLKLMRLELERIGAVNQLAQTQYEDQISRYKELSIRMNELEKERMAIVEFIEEIEQKKLNAFMEAFNRTNERIDRYFSKLTDGGNAALKLENPESPFAGGVDMIVQFLGKPPILVTGASSGERSVAAVAFLFALQEFTPASFYLLDEIDAHLDAFHVERLGELLADEASKSQFVVVTLKPEMVSKADKIYGVYGREGVSHVVSTTFKGAAQ